MGLSQVNEDLMKPIFTTFYEDGMINFHEFSLCFGKQGGKFYLGGYNEALVADPYNDKIKWFDIVDDKNYIIKLEGYKVGHLTIPKPPKTAKFDSGVTMVYITKQQFSNFDQAITKQ